MKILHIIPYYKPAFIYGGPVVSVSQLCEYQVKLGHDVNVFTTTANGDKEFNRFKELPENVDSVHVYYFNRLTKNNTFFSPDLLLYLIKNIKRYEIIHIHSWWNTVAVLSVGVCLIRGIKPILSPRGMLSDYSFTVNNSFIKKILHFSFGKFFLRKTIIHAASKIEEDIVINKIAPQEIIVLPNIIELPICSNSCKTMENFLNIAFLSRIHQIKGLEILIKALKDIPIDFKLNIAGDGELKYLNKIKKLIIEIGLEKKINWIGWVHGQEKYKFLESNDLFVLPSYSENFANSVIESLYMGTPVLISDKVGLSDYVIEKDLGWISEVNVNDLKEKILLAHNDVAKRKMIREIAPQIVKSDYSGNKVALDYLNEYKKVFHC